ncbi:hypothetical protein HYW83_04165 [Candidatus Peregrinibacteria bacterium]|nr:hypothetical protein [Candidatus Peregrinibacteria bacterium]
MAGPETHHAHHDTESLNRFEQDRGRISGEQIQGEMNEWLGSLPDDVIAKIRDLLTGKEDGEVDDEKEGTKMLFYYLFTLYRLDVEDAFRRVDAMDDADRQVLVSTITGNPAPDAVIDDEDPAQLQALLAHFHLDTEGRFAKIFLKLYEEKFALKKPTDALLQNVPTEREIEDQIDQCVNTGGPAIVRLRVGSIAKLKKLKEEFKIADADFPEVLDRIDEILERLQTSEKETDEPEKERDKAKRTLDEKTASLDEPKDEERLAKEDLDRERERLMQKPKENLARAEKRRDDAAGDEKEARYRYEKAHDLYIKEKEVAAKQTPPPHVDDSDLKAARERLTKAEQKLDEAKEAAREAQKAVDDVEDNQLKPLKDQYEAAKKARIDAERALEPFKRNLRATERELAEAKEARKPVAKELKDIPKAEVHAQLKKFFAKLDEKKKTAQEGFLKNQPGENIVYLCLKREREALGEKGEYLEKRTAHDTAALAVGVTSKAFAGIEAPQKGVAGRATYGAQKGAAALNPAEWVRTLRSRTDRLFANIPLLKGLQTSSPEHDIKHHFEKEPLPILVELLGYLRHEATEQRQESFWRGIPFHQLTDLERVVKVIEEIVAGRLGDEINKAGDKGWEKAHAVLDESLHKPLAHVEHKFDEVKRDLGKHHPAGGVKEGEDKGKGHGGTGSKVLGVAGSIGGALAGIGHVGDLLRGRKPSGGGKDGGSKPSGGGAGGHESDH